MLDWYAFVSYPRFRIHHFTAEAELRGFVAIRKEFFPGWKVSVQRFTDDLGLHSPGDDDRDTGRRGHTDLRAGRPRLKSFANDCLGSNPHE